MFINLILRIVEKVLVLWGFVLIMTLQGYDDLWKDALFLQ